MIFTDILQYTYFAKTIENYTILHVILIPAVFALQTTPFPFGVVCAKIFTGRADGPIVRYINFAFLWILRNKLCLHVCVMQIVAHHD